MAGVQRGLAEAEAADPASATAAMDIEPCSISSSSSTPVPASPVADAAEPQSGWTDEVPCTVCGKIKRQRTKHCGKCGACWRRGERARYEAAADA